MFYFTLQKAAQYVSHVNVPSWQTLTVSVSAKVKSEEFTRNEIYPVINIRTELILY